MYDVALYGHLVFDTITINNESREVGGIVNVWKSLGQINPKLKIYNCPTSIGTSSILINKLLSNRESISRLNEINVSIIIKEAKISHIAYINEIIDPSFINNLTGHVAADICSGEIIDLSKFPKINTLFVSEEDLGLIYNLDTFKGDLIIHGPKSSYYKNGSNYSVYHHTEYLKNINVLGAGDYYAAQYIDGILKGKTPSQNIIESHIKTTKYLKDRK